MTQFVAPKLIFQISYSSCGYTDHKCNIIHPVHDDFFDTIMSYMFCDC